MARLEIEIAGVNTELKKILKESKIELSNFSRGLNFKPQGITNANQALTKTRDLLKEITALSGRATSILGGALGRASNASAINDERLALQRARVEAQNYRTESARLRAEIDNLRLSNTRNRQSITAAAGSYREAQQRLTALGQAIRNAEGGFRSTSPQIQAQIREYRRLNDELKRFDARLGNHQRDVGRYGKALEGLKGLAVTYFGFTALLAAGRQVIRSNAEISDSLSDVRRTAGLSAKEATALGKSLKGIDTRTDLKDLLGISTIGGQLGIAKDQLAGFTQAIDQLAVSLKGELQGGAEGIAKSLGVLDNVFGVTAANAGDVNKAYNQIGSAILGLGQSGLATGDFLADFGERVGGLAKQAGLALPVILSYGAVLQENGVSAEVAGTAFKRLLSAISSNSAGFLKVAQLANANLTLKEFNTIINTDTKKALDLFFQGLQKGGTSTVAFNTILKSLKLSGAGVSQVVAALSQNQEALNGHIKDATKDFNEATLSSEQFALKNDNLAASLSKLGNAFTNITTNPDSNLGSFFKSIIDGATNTIKHFDQIIDRVRKLQYDIAIKRFDKNGSTGNLFINNDDVKQEKASRKAIRSQELTNEALKLGAKLNRDAILDIQAESNAKTILAKTNERLSAEEKKLSDIRAQYSKATTSKTKDELGKQLIAQREFVRLLNREAEGLTPRSNAVTPPGFSKAKKSTGGISKDYVSEIAKVSAKATDFEALLLSEGVDNANEKTKQKYADLNSDLDNLQKEYTKKYSSNILQRNKLDAQSAAARKLLEQNLSRELAKNEADFNEKKADIISGIQDKAGVVREESLLRDLQINSNYYNELEKKYKDHADILNAITQARVVSDENITQKWRDKFADQEQKLYDKIQAVTDKGYTDNVNSTAKGTAQIQKQLDERVKAIRKYYKELQDLNKGNPLAQLGLAASSIGAVKNETIKANDAKNPTAKIFQEDIRNATKQFGNDFISTLLKIRDQSGTILGGIITGLGSSLNATLTDVFSKRFSTLLSGVIDKATAKLSTGLTNAIAGAGLLGGVISGATNKTSAIGQGLGGALSGAASGAVIGTIAGPLGTVVGGAIGGLAGLLGGIFGSKKARKQEELQKQQLEEQKKATALLERQNALAYAASIIGTQTVNGVVTGVDRNEFGQLTAVLKGQDIVIAIDRANKSRNRGT